MDADIQTPGLAPRTHGLPSRLMGDERLAQEVGAGNERAFNTLFQRYHQQLYRYCRGLTGTDQDAQDALQTTFTKALVALREGRRNAPLRPWLYRIAHNESISAIRARVAIAGKVPLDLAANVGVSDRAEERERIATLVADLRELPEQQRGALVMRELSGLSHEEIAEALLISVGAAKQSILEARRSLLEFEEGRAMPCEDIQRIISDDDRRSLRSRRVRAHMRDCAVCAAFAQAIPSRRADMLALWPVLPAATSAGLLAKITAGGASSGHGGGAGLAAGTAAKGIGATISVKAAVATGAAVLTTATVGAVAVLHPHTSAPGASSGATSGHKLSDSKASVSGHGSAVTRAAASAHSSTSNHQAIGKGRGPAASKHAAGHSSHGKSTPAKATAGSSTAPGQTRNYGHSGARSATATHHGARHTAHGKPVKVNPSVLNKSTNRNVGHGRLKPRTHKPTHVSKPKRQPPAKATVVTHTRTSAAVTTTTKTTPVTRTKTTRIVTTTPAITKTTTRTTAATTTKTTAAPTTRTTGEPTTTSTQSSVPAATTLTASTSAAATSSTPSTPASAGVGNGGAPAPQSTGSASSNKTSK